MLKNSANNNKNSNGAKANSIKAQNVAQNVAQNAATNKYVNSPIDTGIVSSGIKSTVLNSSHMFATLQNNVILFISAITVIIMQFLGITVKKTKSISFAVSGLFSLFILFFVSVFPLIGKFGRGLPVTFGNIFGHIFNPVNSFFILFIQTMMNFIESIPDVIPYTKRETEKVGRDIAGLFEGYSNSTCFDSTKTDKKEKDITSKVEIETMVIYKNIILILTSVTTFLYLLMINMYGGTSSFIYKTFLVLYLGLFTGYSYMKYNIYLYYKYYITDAFSGSRTGTETGTDSGI